jgi:hypothetical protein
MFDPYLTKIEEAPRTTADRYKELVLENENLKEELECIQLERANMELRRRIQELGKSG